MAQPRPHGAGARHRIRCAPLARWVAQAIAQASAESLGPLRPVGAGTALSPLAAGNAAMLHTRHLRGIVSADAKARTVTVLAGTPLLELQRALELRGLMLEHLGGNAGSTVGGALATGAHGAGLGMGRLSAGLTELRLVDASGQPRRLRANDPHFAAAALSLGALGVLTQVTLRVRPLRALKVSSRSLALGELVALAPEYALAAPQVSLTWRPARADHEAAVLRQGHWAEADEAMPSGNIGSSNNSSLPSLSSLHASLLDGAAEALAEPLSVGYKVRNLLGRGTGGEASLLPSAALLAHAEPLRELEYTVPIAALSGALRDLRRALAKASAAGTALQLPVQVRPLAADHLPLGIEEDSAAITLAAPLELPPQISGPHFREAEAVLRAHGGRPSWGKLHGLGESDLAPLFPHWADFRAARNHFDPERRLSSPYLRRVLGE